jgi:hypothetical protein
VIAAIKRADLVALASPALITRGCVHVIGFDALRVRAGARWAKIQASVHVRLETILRQQLGPSDYFVPLDEGAYLVIVPGSEPEDAEIACLRAAYELSASYLGECALDAIHLYRATHFNDTAIGLERIRPDRLTAIAELAGISPGRGSVPDTISFSQRYLSHAAIAPDPELEFQPVWDTFHEAIMLNVCKPRELILQSTPPVVLSLDDLTPAHRVNVEISCLSRGVAILTDHLARGRPFVMIFQIGYETLNSHAARVEFARACRELPSDLRQYLVFQLVDVPAGVVRSRLGDLVLVIKPFANAVMFEVPNFLNAYDDYAGLGLQTIGMNLARPTLSAREQAEGFSKLARFANTSTLSTFLAGVSDGASLLRARQAGIRFMTGPVIGPPLPAPNPVRRLDWNMLMRSLTHRSSCPSGEDAD